MVWKNIYICICTEKRSPCINFDSSDQLIQSLHMFSAHNTFAQHKLGKHTQKLPDIIRDGVPCLFYAWSSGSRREQKKWQKLKRVDFNLWFNAGCQWNECTDKTQPITVLLCERTLNYSKLPSKQRWYAWMPTHRQKTPYTHTPNPI